ncbi:MAG: cytochrome c biogenesis protein CcdA [Flavobacteriales bacterium]|jgi:thiol:disulfide interchange protein DsbD|nr:cytochrome c biogenesis protein CcdA [Flavobacteriales bacterium]
MRNPLLLLLWALPALLVAQMPGGDAPPEPVKWSIATHERADGQWDLEFKATIDEGWAVYSQNNYGDMGPWPTTIAVDSIAGITLVGPSVEAGDQVIEGHDELFDMEVKKFKGTATFTQRVQVSGDPGSVTGFFEYMTCNDEMCLPPTTVYYITGLGSGKHELGTLPFTANDPRFAGLAVRTDATELRLANVDLANPIVRDAGARPEERNSLVWIFMLGFIGGLVALLTPCVFPMIPLTVSFFTKSSTDRATGLKNALTYGGFILLIYLIFSIPFHLLGSVNPEIFNEISTNPWLNIGFFVIFIVFAISFFGYFEITLPSSWVNKMDSNASKFGGLIGTFFMALTLALVSFSCTGPILGSLLAGALTADGGAWQLTAGMGGFGLALALPFGLFALFPGWLNSLPRSGSWLNSVKVVLGFVEVALAFKFLSMADLVMKWGLVPYELFLAIWVLCGLGIVLYLLGKIKFPHDSPVLKYSPTRLFFIALFGVLTVYMSYGFRYDDKSKTFAPVGLLSGISPSPGYSWIFATECPAGLSCFHDLESGMAEAKRTGKPMLIDFTGYGCANCRKMEDYVWPVAEINRLIDQQYVLVSLYVDDKSALPKDQQFIHETANGTKKPILTVGNKWATLQTETFRSATQPLYALLSPDGVLLTDPVGYTPDVADYKAFLERGVQGMQELQLQASR